ncbi:hypothetical protein [Actinoplanes awajinensis]|uniref:Uncharacterized protein n=1 Tax=Actinoplanes awajinensis subsp. mycoplanecinus TaxID=135947 RepID=A0A117MPZ6_9ACTN|nr:hypothetical protein [Actinoplanes awajinensis]KUL29440.1 hypothetical protein ADL15_27880 [Actinoplanes awajinensis subsp. mycoplanecinus]
MTDQVGPGTITTTTTAKPSRLVAAIAIVVLLSFGSFVAFMVIHRDASEVSWTRMAWLFSSVEAIAFGAAGAIFGSSIQRQRAETAEQQARTSADEAARGRALAETLKADDPATAPSDGLESLGAEEDRTASRHAAIARKLFP